MNYLGSLFKEKDPKIYYTDNEQKKNRFKHAYSTYTLMPYTHKYCSLKKSTAQLHNCTHTLNYRPNWKIENFEYAQTTTIALIH